MITAHFNYNRSTQNFKGKHELNSYIQLTFGVAQNKIIEHDNGAYIVLDIITKSEYPRYERIGYYTHDSL